MCFTFHQKELLAFHWSLGMLVGVFVINQSSVIYQVWYLCPSSWKTFKLKAICGSSSARLAMGHTYTLTMTWTFQPGRHKYQDPRLGTSSLHQSVLPPVLVLSRLTCILGTWSLSTQTSGCTPPRCWTMGSVWSSLGSSVKIFLWLDTEMKPNLKIFQ